MPVITDSINISKRRERSSNYTDVEIYEEIPTSGFWGITTDGQMDGQMHKTNSKVFLPLKEEDKTISVHLIMI